MTSPFIRIQEINLVNQIVESCSTLEDTALASKAIDHLEVTQPEEKAVIKELRNMLCDISYDFYAERYGLPSTAELLSKLPSRN